MMPLHYIGGSWVQGEGEAFHSRELVAEAPKVVGQRAQIMQVLPALASANTEAEKVQKDLAAHRKAIQEIYLLLLKEKFPAWAQLESSESGLPLQYLREGVGPRLEQAISAGKVESSSYPMGQQFLILPSMGALECAVHLSYLALMAGNAVVVKPSSRCFTGVREFVHDLTEKLSCSKMVNFVLPEAQDIEMFIQHPALRQVVFVGRPENGRTIEKVLAGNDKKFVGLYGGKNSAIVLPDADISNSVKTILRGSFIGAGRLGVSFSRVLVAQKIFDAFQEELALQFKDVCYGDPLTSNWGGVLSSELVGLIDRIKPELLSSEGQVCLERDMSSENGASTFGVYRHVSFCSEWQQNLSDVPLLLLNDFKYTHEAVKWANTTPYSLTHTVFTEDSEKYQKAASKLQASVVKQNKWLGDEPQAMPVVGGQSSSRGVVGGSELESVFSYHRRID